MSGNIGSNNGTVSLPKNRNIVNEARYECEEKSRQRSTSLQVGLEMHAVHNIACRTNKGVSSKAFGSILGFLKILVVGLMLSCGTAYASEPPSPVPVTMTKNKAIQSNSIHNDVVSADVGDSIFDWTIGFFIIILGIFFSIQFLDSRKKGKQ